MHFEFDQIPLAKPNLHLAWSADASTASRIGVAGPQVHSLPTARPLVSIRTRIDADGRLMLVVCAGPRRTPVLEADTILRAAELCK